MNLPTILILALIGIFLIMTAKQEKKKDLEDPSVIEKKAREDLGLVKEREIPYIK